MVHRLPPKALEHHLGIENGRPPGIEYASYGSERERVPTTPHSGHCNSDDRPDPTDLAWSNAFNNTFGPNNSHSVVPIRLADTLYPTPEPNE